MARTLIPTLIPFGFEAPLRTGVLSPAAGVLANGDLALFDLPELGASMETQRFGLLGRPRGPVVELGPPETLTGGVAEAHVAGLSGGGYAVAWTEALSQATTSHYAVVDGRDQLVIRDDFGTLGRTTGVAVAGLPGGGFALVETVSGIQAESAALNFQRFDAQGAPVGDLLSLAAQTGDPGTVTYSDPQAVAVAGGVELLWIATDGVHAGRVGTDDSFEQRLISAGLSDDLDAARLSDGRVVATWAEQDGDTGVVMAAVFDPTRPDLPPTEVTVGAADVFFRDADPQVVALRNGTWAVSWHEGEADGSTTARAFSRTGVGGPEFDAHGDFVGASGARVASLRVDAEGDVFLSNYLALNLPATTSDAQAVQAAQAWLL